MNNYNFTASEVIQRMIEDKKFCFELLGLLAEIKAALSPLLKEN